MEVARWTEWATYIHITNTWGGRDGRKQNTVIAADLDNVLQKNFSFWMDSEIRATEQIQKPSKQEKFVVKFNLQNISIYLMRYMSFCYVN